MNKRQKKKAAFWKRYCIFCMWEQKELPDGRTVYICPANHSELREGKINPCSRRKREKGEAAFEKAMEDAREEGKRKDKEKIVECV